MKKKNPYNIKGDNLRSLQFGIKMLLTMKEQSLYRFCQENRTEFPYVRTYERLYRLSMTLEEANRLVKKIDPSKSVVIEGDKVIIR